jgi:hypothetical protein
MTEKDSPSLTRRGWLKNGNPPGDFSKGAVVRGKDPARHSLPVSGYGKIDVADSMADSVRGRRRQRISRASGGRCANGTFCQATGPLDEKRRAAVSTARRSFRGSI